MRRWRRRRRRRMPSPVHAGFRCSVLVVEMAMVRRCRPSRRRRGCPAQARGRARRRFVGGVLTAQHLEVPSKSTMPASEPRPVTTSDAAAMASQAASSMRPAAQQAGDEPGRARVAAAGRVHHRGRNAGRSTRWSAVPAQQPCAPRLTRTASVPRASTARAAVGQVARCRSARASCSSLGRKYWTERQQRLQPVPGASRRPGTSTSIVVITPVLAGEFEYPPQRLAAEPPQHVGAADVQHVSGLDRGQVDVGLGQRRRRAGRVQRGPLAVGADRQHRRRGLHARACGPAGGCRCRSRSSTVVRKSASRSSPMAPMAMTSAPSLARSTLVPAAVPAAVIRISSSSWRPWPGRDVAHRPAQDVDDVDPEADHPPVALAPAITPRLPDPPAPG